MKINFYDLQAQYYAYKDEIDYAIQRVLHSCQFIMGEDVFLFENELARYLNCQNVISCASGTDALLLALLAINIKPGDEVITTPFTFVSTAEVISLLGAKPVFADILPNTYTINPIQIQQKISNKTRAIIPVSLFGQPADMDEINQIAKQANQKIYVIEDAAQSLGAQYKGQQSANLSDIGCISFFPTKPLGCYGDGGAITVKDEKLAERIKSLRIHGQTNRYQHKYIGFNCRLDTLQASILRIKLKYLDEEITKRKLIAARYNNLLTRFNAILPVIKSDRTSVYAQYSIRHSCRGELMQFLKNKHIPTAIHYPQPLHLQECFKHLGYSPGDFPIAEKISNEIISLPMCAFLTREKQEYIASTMYSFTNELVY